MKNYRQKKKRSNARKRDREKGIWKYMDMHHVCPNSIKPFDRKYYIYDDVSGMYVGKPNIFCELSMEKIVIGKHKHTCILTKHVGFAAEYNRNFIADRTIAMLKDLGGAWRVIRIK